MYRVAVAGDVLDMAKEGKQDELRRARIPRRQSFTAIDQPSSSQVFDDLFAEETHFADNDESQGDKHTHMRQKSIFTDEAELIDGLSVDPEDHWHGQNPFNTHSI